MNSYEKFGLGRRRISDNLIANPAFVQSFAQLSLSRHIAA
jgi:hypothetical protein